MEKKNVYDFEFLSEIPERVTILIQDSCTWVCFVDGKPYLVESPKDYAFVRERVELFLDRIMNL